MSGAGRKGTVYLVGAGPGDPRLITLKGLQCLKEADVVVYDWLVDRTILANVRPDAELIRMGKRGGLQARSQDEINTLLVEKAREGKTVVRLKGGDPFVFGRGGEEALALVESGLDYEVVPGVSSAFAAPAYAGIPITQRGYASYLIVATGHPVRSLEDISWEALGHVAGTGVFLMGVSNLSVIVERLITHGRSPETPVALIRWGTRAEQETLVGTLEDVVGRVEAAGFKPPAVIVVGEVVKLRETLAWLEKKPLFGRRILVTRAQAQAGDLSDELYRLGAQPIEFPTIRIEPPESYEQLDGAIGQLAGGPGYDWVVFTSANGVKAFFSRLSSLGKDARALADVKLAAIGPATARALERLLLRVDYMPSEFRAEGVIAGMEADGVRGKRVLIPRAAVAREILPQRLAEAGAEVEVVPVYKTVPETHGSDAIREMLYNREVDIVTFTSSSTVKSFVSLFDGDLSDAMRDVAVACIGPITAETARGLGVKVDVVAAEYTVPGLVRAIVERMSARPAV